MPIVRKLPDDGELKKLVYQNGLTNTQIAEMYGTSPQAVNYRLSKLGITRRPWTMTARAILEAAWPSDKEFKRSEYVVRFGVSKELVIFIRWRLGDPSLSDNQLHLAKRFAAYSEKNNVVLSLDVTQERPWVWVPRTPADGRLVIRWPEGREKPKGKHLEGVTLPPSAEAIDSSHFRL